MNNCEMNQILQQSDNLFRQVLAANHVHFADEAYDDLLQEMRIAVFSWMQDYPDAATFLAAFSPGRLYTRLRWLLIDCLRKRQVYRKGSCPLTAEEDLLSPSPLQDPLILVEMAETWQQFWFSLKACEQQKLLTLLAEAESSTPLLNRRQRYKYRQQIKKKLQLFLDK